MRSIRRGNNVYRGIDTSTGKWVEGNLMSANVMYIEINEEKVYFTVREESIGKWSNLKDKAGYKIFEGDILEISRGSFKHTAKVMIWRGYFRVDLSLFGQKRVKLVDLLSTGHSVRVVGNVYKN